MKHPLLALLASAALLSGCATIPTLSLPGRAPSPSVPEKSEVFQSGAQHSIRVQCKPQALSGDLLGWPAVTVEITNDSDRPLDVSSDRFAAFSGETKVPVLLPAEYEAFARPEQESQERMANMGTWMHISGSMLNSMRTPASDRPTPNRSHLPYQSNLQRAWLRRTTVAASGLVASPIAPPACKSSAPALSRNQLPPRAKVSGILHFDGRAIQTNQPLRLLVTLDGESHEIVFDVKLAWKAPK